ncbi:tyrosine-type recombinase/integrase [Methanococcus maripaludis]|uniref:Tyrosine recombinase XerC n=1 Tax=Methanococcus maripaludis TaxID=39152 RepID=A0A2L1C8I5_METMI|nr:site-specific integrase [Methanococcus maripaludis]AVB75639.1 Tyrosine recombinase XerC [Methanococcus maripaludis]
MDDFDLDELNNLKDSKKLKKVNNEEDFKKQMDFYKNERIRMGIKEYTIKQDCYRVNFFFKWLKEMGFTQNNLNITTFELFFDYMRKKRKISNNTQNKIMISLKKYFEIINNPCMDEFLKKYERSFYKAVEKKETDFIEPSDVKIMCDYFEEKKEKSAFRCLVFLRVLFETAGRFGEVLKIRIRDIDFEKGIILLRETKTSIPRKVAVSKEAKDGEIDTLTYLKFFSKGKSGDDCLFPSEDDVKKPMSKNAFYRHYVKAVRYLKDQNPKLKNKHITVHTLRHSRIVDLLRQKHEIVLVKEYAGHENIETTMIYAHALQRMNETLPMFQENIYK